MVDYLSQMATELGVGIWLLSVIMVWSTVWKLFAMWKSAQKGHIAWFIVLALINTIGILPILYIYVFSKFGPKGPKTKEKKKTKKKKSSKKKK